MFLKKTQKKYKEKGYEHYSLTESYREGGKVKHRNIAKLGVLSPEQAERIRLVLKIQRIDNVYVGDLSDVVVKKHYRFLDVAVMDYFWRQFELDSFFFGAPYAEAMAINRCLDPLTKIHIKQWVEATVLPRLLKTEFPDEYEVYRALDQIDKREDELQQHLYRQYIKLGYTAGNTVFYDITSSYFEGTKCVLAAYGYSRDHRSDRKQIVIALVITPDGYPLYWKVMPGNTPDVTTVAELLAQLKTRFGIEKCLLVFDRGMVSADNLKTVAAHKFTYISAMDKDEIRTLELLEPEFPELLTGIWQEKLQNKGFHAYNKSLFYREHMHTGRRHIIAFNSCLYREQQESRTGRLTKAKEFLVAYNLELSRAQKSRNKETTERKITSKLRYWQLHKVIEWQLNHIALETEKGRKVNSFEISYTVNEEKLKTQSQLDGILCFVTNDTALTPRQVIHYYRRKNIIEDAFRELKSYLRLRPFHLTRKERIKAHVTICVLSYLLLNALEEKLERLDESPSGPAALKLFKDCRLNRIAPAGTETYVESITELTGEQWKLLAGLGLGDFAGKKYLNKILEHSTM